jgi:DNA repair protein RecO (recombination protein O)
MLDVIKHLTPQEEAHAEVFHLLLTVLRLLEGRGGTTASRPVRDLLRITGFGQVKLLSLAGYQPRLDACVRCGREAPPGRLTFSPGLGGVLCRSCPGGPVGGFPMTGGLRAFLRQVVRLSPGLLERYVLSESCFKELGDFLDHYTRYILGKEIPSHRFAHAMALAVGEGAART